MKNIFDKVFTSESKLDAFNNQDNLIEMLDEIFDDFKYETLRFLLEWKNTNGNIKEILKIREIHPSKVFLSNKNKTSLKNSTIVIANYIENEDFNSNIYVKSRMSYQQKSEESEDFQTKIRILAYGFPYHLKKIYDVNMNYYKLAEKSVKYLTEKPKKLFSIDFPLVN